MDTTKLIFSTIFTTTVIMILYLMFFVITVNILQSLGKLKGKRLEGILVDHIIIIYGLGLFYICYKLLI